MRPCCQNPVLYSFRNNPIMEPWFNFLGKIRCFLPVEVPSKPRKRHNYLLQGQYLVDLLIQDVCCKIQMRAIHCIGGQFSWACVIGN
jgi:hypothetical protein